MKKHTFAAYTMVFKASQIAEILSGVVDGDPNAEVCFLARIEEGKPGALTFLANPKYTQYIYSTKATIVIVNDSFVPETKMPNTLIRVKDAYTAVTTILEYYKKHLASSKIGVEQPSHVDPSAKYGNDFYLGAFSYIAAKVVIGDNVKIYPQCYIGENTVIGDNVTVFPGVKIYSDTLVGSNCNIDSNSVIGADGFGFAKQEDGSYKKVPQIGNVVIEDYVDLGAGVHIDRATMGSTLIERGVKLDNQVHVAHNVTVGKNTVIAAQTGIAGSTKVGQECVIGGQVGISGHLKIGDRNTIQAQSGLVKSTKSDFFVQGTPAFSYRDFNKSYVHFRNLPKILKEIEDKLNSNNDFKDRS